MIYLDHGASSFPKPLPVRRAVLRAMECCANPGRGGYRPARLAQEQVYVCRERASRLFHCPLEQVVCTSGCTQGLNMAVNTLVKPGDRVLTTGFEHNAVVRPLYARGARQVIAGSKLFDWENTLEEWEKALKSGVKAAVMTHVSNVFGYILPLEQMAALCRQYGVPFAVDAAQSAGILPVDFEQLGADFIAIPGHKGLLGPQGTGLLLCRGLPSPLLYGGTGSNSKNPEMPDFLPDGAEAGTMNVPGIAGLSAGIALVEAMGTERVLHRQQRQVKRCAEILGRMGMRVFSGAHQAGTLSFVPAQDCQMLADQLAEAGICVRAGLHCAPQAHESAGTIRSGTVRISFGHDAAERQTERFLQNFGKISQIIKK